MEKIKNLSIRKTIVLYITVSLVICFLLSSLLISAFSDAQRKIWLKYTDRETLAKAQQQKDKGYDTSLRRINAKDMTPVDAWLNELYDFLETWTVLIVTFSGSLIAVFLFYKHKLKEPLKQLKKGSELIAANTLDFSVSYKNKDEMGRLCEEFERMRGQLEKNNREMWKLVEQEKALRAAVAHDIRSPLAVLKGYQEMLLEFVPAKDLEPDRMMEMLCAGMEQIEQLQAFIESMQTLSRLEDRRFVYREIPLSVLARKAEDRLTVLAAQSRKLCAVSVQEEDRKLCLDDCVVNEVLDNLISNALRYAKKEVTVTFSATEEKLTITVLDDGAGFPDNLENVTKPCWHSNPQDDLKHFGLGLYISRVYCEKHGGMLLVGNRTCGGAKVQAVFGKEHI